MNYWQEAYIVRDLAIPSVIIYSQLWRQIPGEVWGGQKIRQTFVAAVDLGELGRRNLSIGATSVYCRPSETMGVSTLKSVQKCTDPSLGTQN